MAPELKSGMAIMSCLGRGYAICRKKYLLTQPLKAIILSYPKVVFKVVGDVGADVDGVLEPGVLGGRGVDPELGVVGLGVLLLVGEVANDEADEVRDHRHRLGELERENTFVYV